MEQLKLGGLSLKFMAMLAEISNSSIGRYAAEISNKQPSNHKRNFRYSYNDARKILSEYVSIRNIISPKKKTHAFYNFKGGTGKTTMCYQVAMHLALCGYNILLVDADPQSHLTLTFGLQDNFELPTLFDGVVNNVSLEEIVVKVVDGIDLIPCNLSLTNIEVRLNEMLKKEEALKRYLSPITHHYDFIVFDCNPSISNLNRNILTMSNVIDIVCETHPYSMNGMKILLEDMERFYNVMGIESPELIIIPNKYEDRSTLSAEAMAILYKYYGDYLTPNFAIRKSEEFLKSARDKLPISYFCKSNSIAFEDTADLVKIIINKSKIKT